LTDKTEPIPDDVAAHILVVDDDSRIRSLLSQYLSDHGFRVSQASDAAIAERKMQGLAFDLIILDVMMPGKTGVEFSQWLRTTKGDETPILMLTALGEVDDRIKGLSAGADDFLAKPFDPRELLLRVQNILKRGAQVEAPKPQQVMFGPYSFNIENRQLRAGERTLRLTEREQDFMALMAQRAGEVVPRHEFLGGNSERSVDVQINRLRRKLELDPANPLWLQTVRGIGYKLVIE